MDIQKKIWDFCKSKGMTDAGAAAVLGNVEAESAFASNNLEEHYEKLWGISDEHYVELIDAGAREFVDAAGFGYCQWTFGARKRNLLQFARERGVSIADHDMQLDFMIKELHGEFADVLSVITTSNNVRECTEKFMRRFENPADQSERAISNRTGMAMKWYDKYAHTAAEPEVTYKYITVQLRELCESLQGEDVASLQILLAVKMRNGLEVDGIYGAETKNAVAKYQLINHLTADGICGRNTWSALLGGKTE